MSQHAAQALSRLYTRPPRRPRPTPLERLPFKLQQHYATYAALHGTHIPIEELSDMMVPCAEVIQLCPPDIQPAEGIPWDQPARFLTWIFWPDGRSRWILTREDLAQQSAGYVCYPHVPFPALEPGSPLAGMGETWYGPFASHLCGYPDLDTFHPDTLVWAMQSCTYGERWGAWRRVVGELFALEDLAIDSTLIDTKVVERVKLGGQRLLHAKTERVFRERDKLTAYARWYKDGYLHGIFPDLGEGERIADEATSARGALPKPALEPDTPREQPAVPAPRARDQERLRKAMAACLAAEESITYQHLSNRMGLSVISIRRMVDPYPGFYKTLKAQVEREYDT